jgi:ankyrin repeat protein
VAEFLLDQGADRLATDKNGRGALFAAVTNGSEDMVRLLLKRDNCDDADTIWGFTPLHIAANQGNVVILKQLLDFGCSIYRICNVSVSVI